MYIRLKNVPDLESMEHVFTQAHAKILYDNIKEDLAVLDTAYRIDRSSFSYGGYVILVTAPEFVEVSITSLCDTYHLQKDLYEYDDYVWENVKKKLTWRKRLYVFSSEENLLIYYPVVV